MAQVKKTTTKKDTRKSVNFEENNIVTSQIQIAEPSDWNLTITEIMGQDAKFNSVTEVYLNKATKNRWQ